LGGSPSSSRSPAVSTSSPIEEIKAKDRIVTIEEVVERQPDLIIGSWCGKKSRPERVAVRPGFVQTPAVQRQDVYEIKSWLILQPGPAALTDGLAELRRIIWRWAGCVKARRLD
jgi:iron complex transport system substrate-binding protein